MCGNMKKFIIKPKEYIAKGPYRIYKALGTIVLIIGFIASVTACVSGTSDGFSFGFVTLLVTVVVAVSLYIVAEICKYIEKIAYQEYEINEED